MKIGDEVYVHGYVDEIRYDDTKRVSTIIIRNDSGYFGTVPSEVTKYVKPHIYGKHADAIIIDESNCSEIPNNCETCGTPRHLCDYCIEEDRMWTPKTKPQTEVSAQIYERWLFKEPQTDCSWKRGEWEGADDDAD